MQLIRQIIDVKDRHLVFDLPKSFTSSKAEVIIIPCENKKNANSDKEVNRLLSVSVWGAQDVKRIQKAQRDIGKWKVKTF